MLEPWSWPWPYVDSNDGSTIMLKGYQRGYLAHRPSSRDWSAQRYDKLRLLGRTLRWTIDVSNVGCNCNAALYLTHMPQPDAAGSRYCDIQWGDPERCLEIDLFEGNIKASVATLHTQAGEAADGTCNQWGCQIAWGPGDDNCKYGMNSPNVDSGRPFDMSASFDSAGRMTITVSQDGRSRRMWDVDMAGNNADSVPDEASERVAASMQDGLVLVASLWSGGEWGLDWLDGGCTDAYPTCNLAEATFTISNLHIDSDEVESPWPPPHPLPPPMPPRPPPLPGTCDQARCTSVGGDCCAPPELDEDATCSAGFTPIRTHRACLGWAAGTYVCCPPPSPPSPPSLPPSPYPPPHPFPPPAHLSPLPSPPSRMPATVHSPALATLAGASSNLVAGSSALAQPEAERLGGDVGTVQGRVDEVNFGVVGALIGVALLLVLAVIATGSSSFSKKTVRVMQLAEDDDSGDEEELKEPKTRKPKSKKSTRHG